MFPNGHNVFSSLRIYDAKSQYTISGLTIMYRSIKHKLLSLNYNYRVGCFCYTVVNTRRNR